MKGIVTSITSKFFFQIILTLTLISFFSQRVLAQFGDGIEPPFNNTYTNNITSGKTALTTLEIFISNILGIMTVLGIIMFLAYFIMGAIGWITSGGDSSGASKARTRMMNSIIGLVILVTLYALIGLIGSIVGIDILNPGQLLEGLIP